MRVKSAVKAIILASAGLFGLACTSQAETVISVVQTNYDTAGHQKCTTVRMNPAIFGALPSDVCSLGTVGSFGADRISRTTYDAAGQATKLEQGVGTANQRDYVRYTYTDNGKKQAERDANGNTTTYEYDEYDRLKKVRYPIATVNSTTSSATDYEQFGYDPNGNRTSWRRRDGQTINYYYDALNRVTWEDQPAVDNIQTATEKDVYTTYNLTGGIIAKRLASSTNSVAVFYTYDALGRQTSTTDANNRTVSYQYNVAGARTRLTYPDGNYVDTSDLDYLNRIRQARWNGANALFSQAYNSHGQRKKLLRGAAIPSGEYSDAACVTANNATCYSYDAVARVTGISHDLNNTAHDVAWIFSSYNPANQIISWSASSTVYDYRETETATTNLTFDGLNRDSGLVPETTACPVGGFDARANLICDGNRTFRYDLLNRLQTATGNVTNLKLGYDAEGRLARYSIDGGSTYKTFLYDGVNLIGVYGPGGALEERYVHGAGTDEPLVWFTATTQRYLWSNYQGSVIVWSDENGNAGEIYKYGAYGEPLVASPGSPDNVSHSFSGSRFRYTGQTALAEPGLYYYKARVYDPSVGRFLQTDPVGSKDDLDLYAYVGGDPINKTDPTGNNAAALALLAPEVAEGAALCAGPQIAVCGGVAVGVVVVGGAACALIADCRNAVGDFWNHITKKDEDEEYRDCIDRCSEEYMRDGRKYSDRDTFNQHKCTSECRRAQEEAKRAREEQEKQDQEERKRQEEERRKAKDQASIGEYFSVVNA